MYNKDSRGGRGLGIIGGNLRHLFKVNFLSNSLSWVSFYCLNWKSFWSGGKRANERPKCMPNTSASAPNRTVRPKQLCKLKLIFESLCFLSLPLPSSRPCPGLCSGGFHSNSNNHLNSIEASTPTPLRNLWLGDPHFDIMMPKNVTALVGKSAYLTCRVRNLGNRTVRMTLQNELYGLIKRACKCGASGPPPVCTVRNWHTVGLPETP